MKFWTESHSDFYLINVSSFCLVYQTLAAIFPSIQTGLCKSVCRTDVATHLLLTKTDIPCGCGTICGAAHLAHAWPALIISEELKNSN